MSRQHWDTQMNASILDFLKANGERLDVEIATALQIPMATVTRHVSQLSAAGEVICCKVTRYIEGQKIEGVSCRLSCNLPAPARGRKPGVKRDANSETNPV
jgi:DNA-binding IclR family transcriptional regulator